MANDRTPYDHYCTCHGYTDKPCLELAERLERARMQMWTPEDEAFWDKLEREVA